jgi:nucleoside-diphosphate-sugar epimerase
METHRGGEWALEAADPRSVARVAAAIGEGVAVLHSIPPVNGADLRPILARAGRVVYLSTTGVYGAQCDVDEHTAPAPRNDRERARVAEEQRVAQAARSWLVLRPAAIYGPGRGIHRSMIEGRHQIWGDGSNYISRIHVDDLAALCLAGLRSGITGAWPVADDEPCRAREITAYCARLLGIPATVASGALPEGDTRAANRRVDGRAIRERLGVELRYPSYRTGLAAALAVDGSAPTS